MKNAKPPERASLGEIVDELTAEARGDDERMWNFQQALQKHVSLPCDGFVIGEPVKLVSFNYDGNQRRGVTATCRRSDGREYEMAVSEVLVTTHSDGSRYVAAYRHWMGLVPYPLGEKATPYTAHSEERVGSITLRNPVELIVLSVKQTTARCRLLRSNHVITIRSGRIWQLIPGEIVVVRPRKEWNYAGTTYLSGLIESTRIDASALGLVPLKLEDQGKWHPAEEYWGEPGEPVEKWAKPIIARGPRRQFEMEQVLPGADPDDPFSDPITESNDRKDAGDTQGARRILMELCHSDLRCLDAHAHLGNLVFDHWPKDAIRHYEVGFRIGKLSLGASFDGLLPWGWIDNRPFLRCMRGFGLCLWRLGRFEEAECTISRMLWLNPSDNQGIRFLTDYIHAKIPWEAAEARQGNHWGRDFAS
ncbi:MAG TPA: hypothetical protein VJX16_25690 [Terriglobales bacterium]|nr:hypothetical protein [Terriglobales bacterium]